VNDPGHGAFCRMTIKSPFLQAFSKW
jgi:hypothetical protein